MSGRFVVGYRVLLAFLSLLFMSASTLAQDTALPPAELSTMEKAEVDALSLPMPAAWTGDYDGMRERRLIRILVAHSRTLYFFDHGRERGIDAEYAKALEVHLNKKLKTKALKMRIALVPVPRDRLLSDLIEGRGDIAAGALTITPEREALVDFASPVATNVREVIVTGPKAPPLTSLDRPCRCASPAATTPISRP